MKLGDICQIRYGKDHKGLIDGGIPAYGSGGVMRYVDRALWDKPSVLIPRKGTLENLFFVDQPFWTVDTLFWTEIDESKVLPKFLYYTLRTKNLAELNVGTAVPSLTTKVLNEVEVEVPSLDVQACTVALLSSFDDAAALNNRTNDYLAALIRLEFDRRFSRETPTIDLGDVMSISTQSIKPNDHIGEIWEHYSIPAYDEMHRPIFELADGIKSNKYVIDSDCILVSKLNPSTKRLWLPRCTSKTSVCSTEFIVYRPKKVRYKSFYYAAIDSETFFAFLLSHVTGSTGSRQRSQPKATLNYPIPNPDAREIEDFCEFADPLIAQQQSNEQETDDLIRLRDTLLPKLIFGELNIDKIV